MKNISLVIFLLSNGLIWGGLNVNAEPWLANRFAQNCAGCHSPSRRNLQAMDRRCTLSCQGCHVNPNGGGLRNFYGKWNQQRWLRSYGHDSNWVPGKPKPAPLAQQKYSKQPKDVRKLSKKTRQSWMRGMARVAKNGPKLIETTREDIPESAYDKSDKQEHIIVNYPYEFTFRVTDKDPYRLARKNLFNYGADFRYVFLAASGDNVRDDLKSTSWPMAFDLGLQLRPYHEKFNRWASFVVEGRYMANPGDSFSDLLEEDIFLRSAYALIEDLPYNLYVMAGIFRPLFGIYTPDHTTLAQKISKQGFRTSYNGVSVGGSPNVPFLTASIISPVSKEKTDDDSYLYPQDKGVVVTVGGRFVTAGASVQLSYWDTKEESKLGDLKKQMYSFSFGGNYKNLTATGEVLLFDIEKQPGSSDAGMVTSLDVKYKIYKEMYLQYLNGNSNTSSSRTEGYAVDNSIGFKGFIFSGLELDALVTLRDEFVNDSESQQTIVKVQAHTYF